MIRNITLSLLTITVLFFSGGCEDSVNPDPETGNALIIQFDHHVDGAGVLYNQMKYKNAAGYNFSVMTLKYYISDPVLFRYDGSKVEIDTFHYRDIQDPSTRTLVLENIPEGEYAFLGFTFGLDSIDNVSGSLPLTQENNNMEWPEPMGGGYHYMKFEGRYLDQGQLKSFNTHLGRLQTMPPQQKIYENFFEVELPFSGFIIGKTEQVQMQILMNLNEWYRSPHIYDFETFGPAIMGNQQAQQQLKENGKTAFTTGRLYTLKTN